MIDNIAMTFEAWITIIGQTLGVIIAMSEILAHVIKALEVVALLARGEILTKGATERLNLI